MSIASTLESIITDPVVKYPDNIMEKWINRHNSLGKAFHSSQETSMEVDEN